MAVLENFYDQVEGGGSGQDGNYGDSYELDRNTGGGGGGGTPTRGGGGTSTQQIIRGCTDPSALNYNFKATVNSGCKYPVATPKPPAVLSQSRTILVNVTSNGGGTIVLDGKDTLSTPSKSYVYSGKQLLTPKYFKIARAGYLSEDEYKLFSVKRKFTKTVAPVVSNPYLEGTVGNQFDDFIDFDEQEYIPIRGVDNKFGDSFGLGGGRNEDDFQFNNMNDPGMGRSRSIGRRNTLGYSTPIRNRTPKKPRPVSTIEYDYYEFRLQKNGKEIPLLNQINKITDTINKAQFANLDFDLTKVIIKDDPKDNPIVNTPVELSIESFVSADNIIQYKTSWGKSGFLINDGDVDLEYLPENSKKSPSVTFSSVGISDFTHTVTFKYNTPENRTNQTNRTKELTIDLVPGQTNVVVNATKVAVEPSPLAPSIAVDITQVKLNLADKKAINIPYRSANADKVFYTLGKTRREIAKSGSLSLKNSDFYNGVGNYTIYLQAISNKGGSSENEKISVTVESRAFIPGPDITNINYPQNIIGADFKGNNVPFDISWQSINTNYIKIYAGRKINIASLGKFSESGLASFNIKDVLQKLNLLKIKPTEVKGVIQFDLVLIPYNEEGDSLTEGKTEKISISFEKGDLNLRRGDVISDIKSAFVNRFDSSVFKDSVSPFLTHYLHLGEGNNKLVATWGIDTETLSTFQENLEDNTKVKINEEKSLVLKLYEPLPANVNLNDTLWLSKLQAVPIIDQITIVDDISKNCIPLTPNFALETNDVIGYQVLDDLIATGQQTSADVVNQFVSSSEFSLENLNINFVTSNLQLIEGEGSTGTYSLEHPSRSIDYANFVKYSSAEERVENFVYKVKLIQSYEERYSGLVSGSSINFGGTTSNITGAATSSVAVRNEAQRTLGKISEVKKGFDSFEKFLFTSSSISNITYPGAGQNELSASSHQSVLKWYEDTITSASNYDSDNSSRLVNNLPLHIQNDPDGSTFPLFFDMVGQHFDVLWLHIKGLGQSKKLEHKFENGINDKLIYHMLESLGWDADMGAQSQTLWEYAFGKNSDGSTATAMSGKERQNEVWRRLLNNLPYLHKNKGTRRAISAALSCYGIPQSMLTVMEFGGPQPGNGTSTFTYEDRTSAINITGSDSIIVPWKSHKEKYPDSVEFRVNTDQKKDQRLVTTTGWSLDIDYPESGSLAKLTFNILSDGTYVSSSTEQVSFFNDEYTQIAINRITGSIGDTDDTYTVYLKEGLDGRIRNSTFSTFTVPTASNGWESGNELTIGGSTLTGSIDEFRLWSAPLSESVIKNHTLLPESINGNHISSSTEDLLFRLDFEYPKDRSSSGDTSIKNVSIDTTYSSFATASNFTSITEHPHQYVVYDRNVTAEVPSSGFSPGNKVRFETQTLITDLSYKGRATKKSLDEAPLDSDKLGLFFSPTKEINLDIMKSLGGFEIDNYIGDPGDEFKQEYGELSKLRNYYFERYNLNIGEYIQLVRYIDKSLFDVLESLVPARAKVATGILISPHILERSKIEHRPTTASPHNHAGSVTIEHTIKSTDNVISGKLSAQDDTKLIGNKNDFKGLIDSTTSTKLVGSNQTINATLDINDLTKEQGFITRNSGSDMGGISFVVDASVTGSVQGEYDGTVFNQIGMEPDSLTVAGFGLYGQNGHSIITKIDNDNNFYKVRKRVDVITESYTVEVPENINSSDSSMGRHFVTQTFERKKLSFRNFADSGSITGDNIVSVVPLDGYVPYHYRNVGDLTSGLENSFSNGSKQTSKTTLDGGSPVQTFTTNPNTLRVSDSGRGSGEPILEVD
tara:strand:- start:709 stop:6102 length:5394 start_codon:yes stop_codon:yes gene_type:complete